MFFATPLFADDAPSSTLAWTAALSPLLLAAAVVLYGVRDWFKEKTTALRLDNAAKAQAKKDAEKALADKAATEIQAKALNEVKTAQEQTAKQAGIAAQAASKAATAAASHAEEVKQVLADSTATANEKLAATDQKLANLAQVAVATHTLVNNNMRLALTKNRDQAKRILLLEDSPENRQALTDAETVLAIHEQKQAELDALMAPMAGKGVS
jgi:hypothetical protein